MQFDIVRTLARADLEDLFRAKATLENPGLAMRIADLAGTPIEYLLKKLPNKARKAIDKATRTSLLKALELAIYRIPSSGGRVKKGLAVISGLVGGAMGWPGLVIDLPATTLLILKSIAETAREQGADLNDPAVRLECIAVLGLGSDNDTAYGEEGYFALRAALTQEVTAAASFLAKQGSKKAASATPPAVLRLVNMVAARFSTRVSEKAAAQVIPILGAVSGATINLLFMQHYQAVANAHFTIRRFEGIWGPGRRGRAEEFIERHHVGAVYASGSLKDFRGAMKAESAPSKNPSHLQA